MATFNLRIITPKKVIFNEEVQMVKTRAVDGDLAILAGHTPLVTELAIGETEIKMAKGNEVYFVSGGFLEVKDNKVLLLADNSIKASEIDVEKAKQEKDLYEARMAKLNEDKDIALTQRALQETLKKIQIGESFLR